MSRTESVCVRRQNLLWKEGLPSESPSAYRPIMLLFETGTVFERVIADRLVSFLCREVPDLDNNQFGFRVSGPW